MLPKIKFVHNSFAAFVRLCVGAFVRLCVGVLVYLCNCAFVRLSVSVFVRWCADSFQSRAIIALCFCCFFKKKRTLKFFLFFE